jgi:hypothetical protein
MTPSEVVAIAAVTVGFAVAWPLVLGRLRE